MSPVVSWGYSLPLPWETGAVVPCPTMAGTDLSEHEGGSSTAQSSLVHGGACCLVLPAAHEGTLLASTHDSFQMATPLTLLRSRHLEEEQQAALAALSEQLEAITSVEELTKLVSDHVPGQTVCWDGTCAGADHGSPCAGAFLGPSLLQLRAAGEYEERKLIRAAIRKLRAEEIEGEAPFPCSCEGKPWKV